MSQGRFVGYYRCSTAQQGRSGLGLDAQRESVRAYLDASNGALLADYTEIESGKVNDRPQLARALETCRLTGATLVIANLSRLSRDAHFLLGLAKAGVKFVACDNPHATPFTVHILAGVAQLESEQIADRTKAALAVCKARGQTLGGYRGGPKVDGKLGAEAQRAEAEAFAGRVGPMVKVMRDEGKSLRQIAAKMQERRVLTQRGGKWSAANVRNVLARVAA
jgi:DNA invertase Pin-like site-specific DNA recombinase